MTRTAGSVTPARHHLHCRILHHPGRSGILHRLTDRVPGADVVVNDESPWAGMKAALAAPFDGTHLVVLQDDAIVCDAFLDAVGAVVDAAPDRLVALFHAGQPRTTATEIMRARPGTFVELRYRRGTDWTPSVALAWPRRLVEAFGRWRWAGTARQRGDDLPLGHFASRHGGAVACVPSIVQHPDDLPSSWRNRRARHGSDPLYVAARYTPDGTPWVTTGCA